MAASSALLSHFLALRKLTSKNAGHLQIPSQLDDKADRPSAGAM